MKNLNKGWIALFLVPCIGLLPFLGDFIFGQSAEFSDMAVSHYPNAIWVQRMLQKWGEIPLWSQTILSGYPFSANPLSGLHYPPGWLALIFPQPFGLNLVMFLHIIWLGVGMYYFLRGEELDHLPALLGALAVESMPKLFAHLGAGHVTLVYAVAWTPWLLKAQQSKRNGWWQAGAVLGVVALADPRWAALVGLLWLVFSLRMAAASGYFLNTIKRWLKGSAAVVVLAGLISAALLAPLYEYTRLSTRLLMTVKDNLTLSLPPLQFMGLLTPPLGSTAEWVLYPGGLILTLVLVGVGLPDAFRKGKFWLAAALAALIYAMGSSIPGLDLLARLPGFNLIRVPPRAIFVAGFALAVAAAYTLQVLMDQPGLLKKMRRINPILLLVGLVCFQLAFTVIGWVMTGEFPLRFGWGGVALIGGLGLIFALRSEHIQGKMFALACIAWLLIDLTISNFVGLDFRPVDVVLAQGAQAAEYIRVNGEGARVYSPSYSIPQQTAAAAGLELADGVDPMQLSAYARYMSLTTGVASQGYSVTLPPMINGDPANDNREAIPDPTRLGVLHVGYVVADFDLEVDGLVEETRFGQTRIYKNLYNLPFAWIQDPSRPLGEELLGEVELVRNVNKLSANAIGPGMLVFSEVAYPGWVARVDGQEQEIRSVGGLLRGVYLMPGDHHVELVYQPVYLYVGVVVSLVGWLFVGVLWLIGLRTK